MGNFVSTRIHVIQDIRQAKLFLLAGLVPAIIAVVSGLLFRQVNNLTTLSVWVAILVWMRALYHWRGYEIGSRTAGFIFMITSIAGFMAANSMLMFIGVGGLVFMVSRYVWNKKMEQARYAHVVTGTVDHTNVPVAALARGR